MSGLQATSTASSGVETGVAPMAANVSKALRTSSSCVSGLRTATGFPSSSARLTQCMVPHLLLRLASGTTTACASSAMRRLRSARRCLRARRFSNRCRDTAVKRPVESHSAASGASKCGRTPTAAPPALTAARAASASTPRAMPVTTAHPRAASRAATRLAASLPASEGLLVPTTATALLSASRDPAWNIIMEKGVEIATSALKEALQIYGVYLEAALKEALQIYGVYLEELRDMARSRRIDLRRLAELREEEERAFEKAAATLLSRLNEHAVENKMLKDELEVDEEAARSLIRAETSELGSFAGVNAGTKAAAALYAYREWMLGSGGAYAKAVARFIAEGRIEELISRRPGGVYGEAMKRAKAKRREMDEEEKLFEFVRRLFSALRQEEVRILADRLIKEGGGVLELKSKRVTKGGYAVYETNISWVKLRVAQTYVLSFTRRKGEEIFKPLVERAREMARKVAVPEDGHLYMLGYMASDVGVNRKWLAMATTQLWQLAATWALFRWSNVLPNAVLFTSRGAHVNITTYAPIDVFNRAIATADIYGNRRNRWLEEALGGAEIRSWSDLKKTVAAHWSRVVDAAKRQMRNIEFMFKTGSLEELLRKLEEVRDRLNDDKVAREVAPPALLLLQAQSKEALRRFGMMLSAEIDGDGTISAAQRRVSLATGCAAASLLWGAALAAHGIRPKVYWSGRNEVCVVADGKYAAAAALLYTVYRLGAGAVENHKAAEAARLAPEAVSLRWENLRRTKNAVAADLHISALGQEVKFNLYLHKSEIMLRFNTTARKRAELAAGLLRALGVNAEARKKGESEWSVFASTDQLAAGHEKLRKTIKAVINAALRRKELALDKELAEDWLRKLERGVPTWRGRKITMALTKRNGLQVQYRSGVDLDDVIRAFEEMGLREGEHFAVKTLKRGRALYLKAEGVRRLSWLSVYGTETQRRAAAEFLEFLRKKADMKGAEVRRKVEELIEKGRRRGAVERISTKKDIWLLWKGRWIKLTVEIKNVEAWVEEEGGRSRLRVAVKAVVDGVERQHVLAFYRTSRNEVHGFTPVNADAPGGREEEAKRIAAVSMILTGKAPSIYWYRKQTLVVFRRSHLEGLMRYVKVNSVAEKWLKQTAFSRLSIFGATFAHRPLLT